MPLMLDRKPRSALRDTSHSEEFGDLLGTLSGWIWELDSNLMMREIHGAVDAFLGQNMRSALGRRFPDHLKEHLDPADGEAFAELFEKHEPILGLEYTRLLPDSTTLRLRTTAKPHFSEDGSFAGYRGITLDVTAEFEARNTAHRAETRLHDAVEALTEGFAIFDDEDKLVLCNKQYRNIYGPSARIGATMLEIFEDLCAQGFYRDVSVEFGEALARRREDGDHQEIEYSDGRWFALSSAPLADGWCAEIRTEITAIKAREQVLRESRSHIAAIMDSVAEGVIVFRADGQITDANLSAQKMFECDLRSFASRSITSILYSDEHDDQGRNLMESLENGQFPDEKVYTYGVRGRRDNGETFPVELSFRPLAHQDEVSIVMGIHDVSQREELQEQLAHAARLTSLGELAAKLAHEINQPLAVINMAAENALLEMESEDGDPDYVEERLNAIVGQIERLRELIEHIRSFSRRYRNDNEFFDVCDVVEAAVQLMESQLELAGIDLNVTMPDDPLWARGLGIHMQQAVVNLISNARDAIEEHDETDPDNLRRIDLSIEPAEDHVSVHVTDSGGGIPDDVKDSIFEPFFTTKAPGKGTGIGLSVVQTIISGLNGQLKVENTNSGCCFTITLPLREAPEEIET